MTRDEQHAGSPQAGSPQAGSPQAGAREVPRVAADSSIHAHLPSDAPRSDVSSLRPPLPRRVLLGVREYFLGDELSFGIAVVPLCFLSMLLFTRHPYTNFIFDEQEALLANPYVRSVADPRSHVRWVDAFYRDFWGLTPDRSIGSYRPIPDLVWRALWAVGARDQTPFLHHWVNVLLHGVNGALVTLIVHRVTRDRIAAWLAGALFVGCAVVTEAVSGVVGIADVLGGLGALLALAALGLSLRAMPLAVFAATLFGLYSKESALCCVPLVPYAALLTAQITHPERPRRWLRAGLAAVATFAAFVLYVEARRRMFPAPMAHELANEMTVGKPWPARLFAALLRWYAQPALPRDPLNNPLIAGDAPQRIAGAMRVYWRGLGQVVFPWTLSGDYSSPQEPLPTRLVFPASVLGAAATIGPLLAGAALGISAFLRARRHARFAQIPPAASPSELLPRAVTLKSRAPEALDVRPVLGVAMTWVVVSYFPVSNIPVLLPTVRAERFWYFPEIGTSVLLAIFFSWLLSRTRAAALAGRAWPRRAAWGLFAAFFVFQGVAARRHANDYTDDLVFWDATRRAVPRSAKAHLNYSVMQGARGNLEVRLASNRVALELAPTWPMASVYLGDTLCRLHRTDEAFPFYERGFDLSPAEIPLIALGVQCLWDEHALTPESPLRERLEEVGARHPGSWLEYIVRDTIENGEAHNGVDPKYRPRGYNEGPKGE